MVDNVIKKATDMNMVLRYRDIDEFSNILKRSKKLHKARYKWIAAGVGIAAALCILIIGTNAFLSNNPRGVDALNTHTQQEPNETYDIMADLEFENPDDLSMMQLVGEKIDSGEINEEEFPHLLDNGVYLLRCQTVFNHRLSPGSFVHLRILPETE